jgi:hypothetical protein
MPYPDANAYAITTPSTSLDPRTNGLTGFIGNAHTNRATANGLSGSPMPPFNFNNNLVVFDGTNDYLTRGANLTGLASTSTLTVAFSVRPTALTLGAVLQATGGSNSVQIEIDTSGILQFVVANAGASAGVITNLTSAFQAGTLYRVVLSFNFTANTVLAWVNGAPASTSPPTWFGTANMPLNTVTNWRIGADFTGTPAKRLNAALGLVVVTTQAVTGPEAFFSGSFDRDLGTAGTATGLTAPLVYFGCDQLAANWQAGTNRGTGGAFTATGTITNA